MEWFQAVEALRPHVVRISIPDASGSGYFVAQSPNAAVCCIATAAHVVSHAHAWEEPIRMFHQQSGRSVVLKPSDRAVFLDEELDTAGIVIAKALLPLPENSFPLIPEKKFLKVGNSVGWLGFPANAGGHLCFFRGEVSAWVQDTQTYLVDGVAINGVSGGPVFHLLGREPVIVGVVTAYVANRATGEALPGLSVIRDVSQFQKLTAELKDIGDAKQQESPTSPEPGPGGGESAGGSGTRIGPG